MSSTKSRSPKWRTTSPKHNFDDELGDKYQWTFLKGELGGRFWLPEGAAGRASHHRFRADSGEDVSSDRVLMRKLAAATGTRGGSGSGVTFHSYAKAPHDEWIVRQHGETIGRVSKVLQLGMVGKARIAYRPNPPRRGGCNATSKTRAGGSRPAKRVRRRY